MFLYKNTPPQTPILTGGRVLFFLFLGDNDRQASDSYSTGFPGQHVEFTKGVFVKSRHHTLCSPSAAPYRGFSSSLFVIFANGGSVGSWSLCRGPDSLCPSGDKLQEQKSVFDIALHEKFIDAHPCVDVRCILDSLPTDSRNATVSGIAHQLMSKYPNALPNVCDLPELLTFLTASHYFPLNGDGETPGTHTRYWLKYRWIMALIHPYISVIKRFTTRCLSRTEKYSLESIIDLMGEVLLYGGQQIVLQSLSRPHLILPEITHSLLYDLLARLVVLRTYYMENQVMPEEEQVKSFEFESHQWRNFLIFAAPAFYDRLTFFGEDDYPICEEPRHTIHIAHSEITHTLDSPCFWELNYITEGENHDGKHPLP